MPTKKKKKLPAKKKAVKKPLPKKKSGIPDEVRRETEAINNGNIVLIKFAKDKSHIPYEKDMAYAVSGVNSLYKQVMTAIPKTKFENTKPLLQGLERMKRIMTLREALISSSETGNPMPLWVELVRTVKWLKNKNK